MKHVKVIEKGVLEPGRIAPTDRAAHNHSLRVYLEIVTWKLLDSKEIQLHQRKWRWQCKNGQNSSPITTDRGEAPANI